MKLLNSIETKNFNSTLQELIKIWIDEGKNALLLVIPKLISGLFD